jgi:hypothetical protein
MSTPPHVRHPVPRSDRRRRRTRGCAPVCGVFAGDACGGCMVTRRRGRGIGACAKVGQPPHALAFLESRARARWTRSTGSNRKCRSRACRSGMWWPSSFSFTVRFSGGIRSQRQCDLCTFLSLVLFLLVAMYQRIQVRSLFEPRDYEHHGRLSNHFKFAIIKSRSPNLAQVF